MSHSMLFLKNAQGPKRTKTKSSCKSRYFPPPVNAAADAALIRSQEGVPPPETHGVHNNAGVRPSRVDAVGASSSRCPHRRSLIRRRLPSWCPSLGGVTAGGAAEEEQEEGGGEGGDSADMEANRLRAGTVP